MSVVAFAWLLSLAGASLFFAAGTLWALYRASATQHRKLVCGIGLTDATSPGDTPVSAEALRGILERETRGGKVAGAVIADGLGLVVAATGEFGDALAAYGAVLAGLGSRTGESLPLRDVRRVTIEDEHDMTLTVRPIASPHDHFALVTLTAGQADGGAQRGANE